MDDSMKYIESLDESTLRDTLSKYIEDVPPITVTTRPLLESLLGKYLKEATVINDPNQNTWVEKQSTLPEEEPAIEVLDVPNPDVDDGLIDVQDSEDYFDIQNSNENDVETDPNVLSHRPNRESILSDDEYKHLISNLPSYKREPLHSKLEDIDYHHDETLTRMTFNKSLEQTASNSDCSNWKRSFIKIIFILAFIGIFIFFMSSDFYSNPIDQDI